MCNLDFLRIIARLSCIITLVYSKLLLNDKSLNSWKIPQVDELFWQGNSHGNNTDAAVLCPVLCEIFASVWRNRRLWCHTVPT